MSKFPIAVLAACVTLLAPTPASARLLEDWPYDKLMKASDLVVMAKPVKTAETKDGLGDPNWKHDFVGQNTTFDVLHILKGTEDGKQIKVLHFKLPEGHAIINGPCFISFRTMPVEGQFNDAKVSFAVPDYILYLKRMKDGRYEPVSGRIDPALAVRELHQPLDWLLETAAPVPAAKPPFEVVLKVEPKKSPLDDAFAAVEIRNHTGADLALKSSLPGGASVFLDTEVRDAADKRISEEFYTAMISSPFAEARPVGTIMAGKSLLLHVRLFQGIDDKKLAPGKYKCRVRFRYDTVNAVSDWVTVELTAEHTKR